MLSFKSVVVSCPFFARLVLKPVPSTVRHVALRANRTFELMLPEELNLRACILDRLSETHSGDCRRTVVPLGYFRSPSNVTFFDTDDP